METDMSHDKSRRRDNPWKKIEWEIHKPNDGYKRGEGRGGKGGFGKSTVGYGNLSWRQQSLLRHTLSPFLSFYKIQEGEPYIFQTYRKSSSVSAWAPPRIRQASALEGSSVTAISCVYTQANHSSNPTIFSSRKEKGETKKSRIQPSQKWHRKKERLQKKKRQLTSISFYPPYMTSIHCSNLSSTQPSKPLRERKRKRRKQRKKEKNEREKENNNKNDDDGKDEREEQLPLHSFLLQKH